MIDEKLSKLNESVPEFNNANEIKNALKKRKVGFKTKFFFKMFNIIFLC